MHGDGDASARLRAELAAAREERRQWQERHDFLANNSHDVITRIDATGRITYVSPSVRAVLGYEPQELVGQNGFHFIDPDEQAARRTGFAQSLQEGGAPVVITRVRRKDGSYVWMEYFTHVLHDDEGRAVGFQSNSRDVTARREAEDALRRSEENFESFVLAMPVPAIIHRDAKVALVNRAFTAGFGYTDAELVGHPIFDIVESGDRAYVEERVKLPPRVREGESTREHRLLHKDGTRIPVEVTSVPVFFRGELSPMAVIHDLRERKQLEAQLIAADRMSSLGRLSAAVGHEINNPLAYVLASLTLIDRELVRLSLDAEQTRQIRELLANVHEGADRIRAVVIDLKALSREQPEQRGPVDLARVLDVCAAMADHEIRHRARLVKDYGKLPYVEGSEARLGQVFLNLLINAAQAIPEGDAEGNTIRIVARPKTETTGQTNVEVDIVDSGRGIPPELVSRIFEPFFTTKAGGTGLGLSISHHIVTLLGGAIHAEPSSPSGMRFRVVLPCASKQADATAREPSDTRPALSMQARILVIDDEPQLARLIVRLLAPRTVDVSLSGEDAIARIQRGEKYDALVCDLHMKDLSGMDVYEHVKQQAPGLERRMIFMTGGAIGPQANEFVETSGCPILDKPFDAQTLEASLEQVLQRA